ncbi:MAG: response regulator [bacterium]|nr:response regulator [bacterium]
MSTALPDFKGKLILVVDDEPANRAAIADALIDEGYRYLECENGQIAWDFLQHDSDQVGLLLLDWMMPVMDGPSLLAKIKADHRLKDIPVILQTARVEAESQVEGLDLGACHYLPKPYDDSVLLGMIRAAIRTEERVNLVRAEQESELKDIRDFARNLITKERAQAQFGHMSSQALSRFFPESLLCQTPDELVDLVLGCLGALEFETAAQSGSGQGPSNLRVSLLLKGETDIHRSDRGAASKTDQLNIRAGHTFSTRSGARHLYGIRYRQREAGSAGPQHAQRSP